jgi:DNA uptake protein ComE-like DNA-binding protein
MKRSLTPCSTLALAVFCLAGCTAELEEDEALGMSRPEIELGAEEIGQMLALVNDSGTDEALLDEAVGLDRRAAENILAHRNGPDGKLGNSDDDLFDDIAELDAVAYVGASALEAIRSYAAANPLPPSELVEGVLFDGTQAQAVVWGVNQATVDELDHVVLLDIRAAKSLVALAPFSSVTQMGPIGFVGQHALRQLRFNAARWHAAMQGSLAGTYDGVTFDEPTAQMAFTLANEEPWNGLVESGMWSTGATRIVDNRPYADLAEVAAVVGVGTTTMEQLHHFAFNLVNAPE